MRPGDTVVLDGECSLINRLDGDCSLTSVLDGVLDKILIVHDAEVYTGPYTVTPTAWNEQVLVTEGLLMTDDVTVREVPYYETSNQYGKTIYIADQIGG